MRRYARGLALTAQGKTDEAQKELDAVQAEIGATPADTKKLFNSARAMLTVAHDMLAGQLAIARGQTEDGLALLRKAVEGEDALGYDEPPDWYTPTRHALGAALLKANRASDAEKVYQEELARNPENGWSLFGLAQSLKAQGKDAGPAEERLKKAWANADITLTTTWY
jgi:tetratricopeptide (TPR) repeat protein